MRILIPAVLIAIFALLGCSQPKLDSGIDLSNMDKDVRPQDDFYRHVNGKWLESFEIPADKSNYGSFSKLADEAEVNLREIIQGSATDAEKAEGSDEQKVGDLFLSYMDTTRLETLGLTPLKEDLDRIAKVNNRSGLAHLMGYLEKFGVSKPFGFFINQDLKKSTEYALYLTQSGLGLPDRAYYLTDSEKFIEYRAKYIEYLEKMLTLGGETDVQAKASRIMTMEKAIAEKHWSRKDNRDRDKTYTKVAMSDLSTIVPGFDWKLFLTAADIPALDSLIVRQNTYLESLGELMANFTLEDWKTYLKAKALSTSSGYLNQEFVDTQFEFYGKVLRGREENSPRWKRGVRTVNRTLGEVVGKVYVEKHSKPEAKARMDALVKNLMAAFEVGINELEWMSEDTKQEALKKLASFNTKIGYPDKWKDYSALAIEKDDLWGNIKRARLLDHQREIEKLGGPIDRDEWFMSPQTVNAYYNPPMNEVVFPAAILQPPFFNLSADDAVNYGAIGTVIGHEISHGFDDQGRKSDGDGNLRDWWSKSDQDEFTSRADIMVDQYNQFNPIDTLKVNGSLTLGENIADLGGLTIAYKAYNISLNGEEAPVIDGYSGSERFFLGYAQMWSRKYRDNELRQRLITDSHSPSEYRVNGVLANMPEFYEAFEVKEGDGLFRPDDLRVKIW